MSDPQAKPLRPKRLPGRKPGPAERVELLSLWDQVSDDGRKMMLFMARALAREEGVIPANAPLILLGKKNA